MRLLSLTSGPAWGSGTRKRSPQSIWLGRPAGSTTGLGEIETSLLKGACKISRAPGPRAKAVIHRILGQTYLLVLEGLLVVGGQVRAAVAHPGDMNTGGRYTGEHSSSWSLLEAEILAQDLAPLNNLQAPVLVDTSGQTTKWVGTQPHPSADRLPKEFLSHSHL